METKLEMKSFSAVPKGFPVQEMNFFSLWCVLIALALLVVPHPLQVRV